MAKKLEATEEQFQEALVFYRNAQKAPKSKTLVSQCDKNCDCYVEVELAKAAGIAGYRLGS
jgi:hypothetical protein